MPRLGPFQLKDGWSPKECSIQGCDGEPVDHLRLNAGHHDFYLSLCENCTGLRKQLPVTVWVEPLSDDELVAAQVMSC